MKQHPFVRTALVALVVSSLGLTASGCMSHAVRVEPITVAPVQVTMDVNLHVDDSREATASAETSAPAAD